jgi:ABC-type sugar transport system ATPase subunit/ribose/xylose/arabinose/galactoside ABC-type transport system permease subunit
MIPKSAPGAAHLVHLHELSKRFPGVLALDNVHLDLDAGTIHALLGENGAGKSTLINVLSGVLRLDSGEMWLRGQPVAPADAHAARALGIATVHQESDLFPDLTVAENVALEQGWPRRAALIDWTRLWRTTREAMQDLGRELDPGRLAASLTPAERQLVGIAAALSQTASVLILDEPTSSLSASETAILFGHLRRFRAAGGAVLYVSHRLEEVFQLADVATVLRDGRWVWSGRLNTTTPDQIIARMVGREGMQTSLRPARETKRPGPVRLACEGLTTADGAVRGVSVEVRAGEILGLYGLIGAGRSEWAQAVFGLRPLTAGQLRINGQPWAPSGAGAAVRSGLAYLPEDRLRYGLCAGLSVCANTIVAALRRLAVGPFLSSREEMRQAQVQVDRLAVRLRSLLQPAGTLSGGNQQKVILGRWLACQPETLILDEPTRGVDIGAKAEIHALLRQLADAGRAIVLISSDLPEVLAHSDRVGVFRGGQLTATYDTRSTTPEQVAAAALQLRPDAQPVAGQPASPRAKPVSQARARAVLWLREAGLLVAVVLLAAWLSWRTDTFWQPGTLRDIGEKSALLVLCGLGAALVILAGGIDISFGSIMALGAALTGYLLQEQGWPVPLAVGAGLGGAALAGAMNAGLTLLSRVHPIVITLGTMSLYRGMTLLLIGGREILDLPQGFRSPFLAAWVSFPLPGLAWRLEVPNALLLAVAVVGLGWFLLGWTVAGRQTLALGSNPLAAERTGIHRTRIWLGVFTLEGFLAGVAGLLALAMTGHLQATDFDEKTLDAIGVAVVGGIAITGGRGSVWGIWVAALLFRILEKGWVFLHISGYWQRTIVGAMLLLAILGDRVWRRSAADENV